MDTAAASKYTHQVLGGLQQLHAMSLYCTCDPKTVSFYRNDSVKISLLSSILPSKKIPEFRGLDSKDKPSMARDYFFVAILFFSMTCGYDFIPSFKSGELVMNLLSPQTSDDVTLEKALICNLPTALRKHLAKMLSYETVDITACKTLLMFIPRTRNYQDLSSFQLPTNFDPGMLHISRYQTDFEELECLGHGGFGMVVKAKNKLDGRSYAVKKVMLSQNVDKNRKLYREVRTLSRISSLFCVRYYHAWQEAQRPGDVVLKHSDSLSSLEASDFSSPGETSSTYSRSNSEKSLESFDSGTSDSGEEIIDQIDKEFQVEFAAESTSNDVVFSKSTGNSADANSDSESKEGFKSLDFKGKYISSSSEDTKSTHKGNHHGTKKKERERISRENMQKMKEKEKNRKQIAEKKADTAKTDNPKQILYIQMEYCENYTLEDAIKRGMGLDEVLRYLKQILSGLEHIHSLGLVHRDLKPKNIFLDRQNTIKIGDFGLATTLFLNKVNAVNNQTQQIQIEKPMTEEVGTITYTAPELNEHGRYNQKVDMYSLGIIIFEMTYPMSTGMERYNALRLLRSKEAVLPGDYAIDKFRNTIIQLLSHDAVLRPTSASLLKEATSEEVNEAFKFDQVLQKAADPENILQFTSLMNTVFSIHQIDDKKSYLIPSKDDFETRTNIYKTCVYDVMSRVFMLHGAVLCMTPSILPSFIFENSVPCTEFVDRRGSRVALAKDLTSPYYALGNLYEFEKTKRFSFGRVFRTSSSLIPPKVVDEAVLDVISQKKAVIAPMADIIKGAADVFTALNVDCDILIGHACLMEHTIKLFDIKVEEAKTLRALLAPRETPNMNELFSRLVLELGLPITRMVTRLLSRNFSFENWVTKACIPYELVKHLFDLREALAAMSISHRICFAPLIAHNSARYNGGIFFHFVDRSSEDISMLLASGGQYGPPTAAALRYNDRLIGIGVHIEASVLVKKVVSISQPNIIPSSHVKVMVTAVSQTSLADRLSLVTELRYANISCDFTYNKCISPEAIFRLCRESGIKILVTLKNRATVKIRADGFPSDEECGREFAVDRVRQLIKIVDSESVVPLPVPGPIPNVTAAPQASLYVPNRKGVRTRDLVAISLNNKERKTHTWLNISKERAEDLIRTDTDLLATRPLIIVRDLTIESLFDLLHIQISRKRIQKEQAENLEQIKNEIMRFWKRDYTYCYIFTTEDKNITCINIQQYSSVLMAL